ncbi:MAG: S41 family peptidase [Bacteroidales bacterium]|nr:S41 family peptidase [Bacteroidales bacterium]
MKTVFNMARNNFAVIGLVLSIAQVIVLAFCLTSCSTDKEYHVTTSDGEPCLSLHGGPGNPVLEDFDYFFRAFEQTHPDPYSAFGGKRKFHKKVKTLRRTLSHEEGLDAERLQTEIGRFLVPLHDGHTYCGQMKFSYDSEVRFLPLNLRTMTNGFFVWGSLDGFESLLGAEVLNIAGQPLDKLLDRLAEYVPSENKYGLYSALNGWKMSSALLSLMLDDFDGETVKMRFKTRDGVDTTAVLPLFTSEQRQTGAFKSMPTDQRFPSSNFEYGWADKGRGVMAFRCSHIVSRDCLQYILDHGMDEYDAIKNWAFGDTALEEIPSASGRFGSMLTEMKEAGAQHLIIDLRGNGGGWSPIVYPMLYQLYGDEFLTTDLGCRYETRLSELYLRKNNTTLEGYNSWRGSSYKIGDLMSGGEDEVPDIVSESFRNAVIDGYMCLDKDPLRLQGGEPLYRPEHVYVVTNEDTFSAAFHFTYMLWKMGATIVGVPSAQAPNTFMESTPFSLPNTGIKCSVSNAIQRFLPSDDPRAKVFWPDWTPSWEDYKRLGFDSRADLLYILDKISE